MVNCGRRRQNLATFFFFNPGNSDGYYRILTAMEQFDVWTSEHPVQAYAAVTTLALMIAAMVTGTLQALGIS